MLLTIHWCLTFLLFVLPGAASLTVEGQKGGSVTLKCGLSSREDSITVLIFGHKIAYGAHQDKYFRGRVKESESCDLILQDLETTDAGKYISKVFANGQLLDSYTYDVHVNVSLTGRKGEELMFELPHEAKNVEHFTKPDWTEVWRSGQGVLTDRLTIKNFSSSDAGTYRVLNSSGGILVTVTVTGIESKDKQDSTHEQCHDFHLRVHVGVWIVIGLVVALVVLVALIVFAVIMKRRNRNRNKET